ncbi:hypothetical protein AB0J82_20600 [Asanoa sp. NPDC049518]|uniref:hypothetical protein n=1 Tax=unclassified Asanoa TaxID=2685164 RepID=UPI0034486BB2
MGQGFAGGVADDVEGPRSRAATATCSSACRRPRSSSSAIRSRRARVLVPRAYATAKSRPTNETARTDPPGTTIEMATPAAVPSTPTVRPTGPHREANV